MLVFGCRTAAEDITQAMTDLPPTVILCYSRASAPRAGERGRVTDALARIDFDPDLTDFYLCGSSAMVTDCRQLLEARGARHLFVENY